MPKNIKSSLYSHNAKLQKLVMQEDIDGEKYIVSTPIQSGEYNTTAADISGVSNSPSEAVPGVTPGQLREAIEQACKKKRKQIEALPIAMRGLLVPATKK